MIDRNRQRKLKAVLIFAFCSAFAVARADADMIDPVPAFQNIPESPHWRSLFSWESEPFFCPLSETFFNDPEEVAVETLILEAVGEGYRGMVAVGEVIRNRSKLFSKDFKEVCLAPKQFSCWNDPLRAVRFLEENRASRFIAWMAWIESEKSGSTGGATDYHTESIHPYWADGYQVAAHIGRHIFYVRNAPLGPISPTE